MNRCAEIVVLTLVAYVNAQWILQGVCNNLGSDVWDQMKAKFNELHEKVQTKFKRDGGLRLLQAVAIHGILKGTSPLPHIALGWTLKNQLNVCKRQELLEANQIDIHRFGSPEHTSYHAHEHSNIDEGVGELKTIDWTSPFVAEISDARILGPSALGYQFGVGILLETAIARRKILERDLLRHPMSVVRLLMYESGYEDEPSVEFDELCPLVNLHQNYYHWVSNSLLRLRGLEHFEKQTGRKPQILIRSDPPGWLRDWLDLFGIGRERWVEWDNKRARVNNLVVPSMPRKEVVQSGDRRYLATPRGPCVWLRDNAVKNIDSTQKFSEKVFISRKDASKRRVTNRNELLNALRPLGYREYVLSEMSIQDQVNLFYNAESIVGAHGAGLVNMIFSQDCRIIELASKPYRPTFFMLAQALDHGHALVSCEIQDRDLRADVDFVLEEVAG